MQTEEQPVMATGLERIAAKARGEPKLRFTSLAHHVTRKRIRENLNKIPASSASGCDGQTVPQANEDFVWESGAGGRSRRPGEQRSKF
jgi:RNA-directed DNA polymerase